MLKNVLPLNLLEEYALEIQTFLEVTVSDNPVEVVDRGNDLAVYMAQTTKMLADAKVHHDIAQKKSILERRKLGLSPSIFRAMIISDNEYENYLVNLIERQNNTCGRQLDWIRSVLSKLKEERRYQGNVSG